MTDNFPELAGRKVLVTGADGFIGSHLTEALAKAGADVRAFVLYNSFGHRGWLDQTSPELVKRIEFFQGDIRDPGLVKKSVRDREIVFHLASLIAIPYSYDAPESYVQTNVTGTLNVLNASLEAGVRKLVHTSTSEVYGTALYAPIDEKHPLQGQSPYSASKIGADMMAESFFRSFNLPVATLRPFNTYGPRQSARAVIPTILSQLYRGATEIRVGALTPTRDFNFVEDTVTAFIACALSPETVGQTLNAGSGREISIGNLIELLMSITGRRARIIQEQERIRPDKSEVERLLCDASRLTKLTGWKPRHSLEEGLKITARWVEEGRLAPRSDYVK
jgi:NAD dependent epimerase/dehydratase